MINNSFYKVWFWVIGMMVANVTSLYGAENFDIFTFLNSSSKASNQEVSSFTSYLKEINNKCMSPSENMWSTSCGQLKSIIQKPIFTTKCTSILSDDKIHNPEKEYLAKIYFEIKFNDKIRSQHINLEMPNIIKNQLDPLYLLFVEVDERQPINWQTLSLGKRAENSISAIAELNRIITDNNIDSSVIATTSLRTNLLGYLEYLNDFYTKETNNPAKVGINFILDNNSRSLADLVKITANDEIKKAYSTLKTLVPLPSLDEVLPQLVKSEASPVQPVLTQREMTILDEAIKNPSSDNKALILKTLKKIIAIVQAPNPNSWKLKNEFETIGFDFLWKNTQFDEAIIQIIKKIVDHKTLKNITDNNDKEIIERSIAKIMPFLNPSSSASPQPQPVPQPIVSSPPTFPHSESLLQKRVPTQTPSISAAWPHFGMPPVQQQKTYDRRKDDIIRTDRILADTPDINPNVINPMRQPQTANAYKDKQRKKELSPQEKELLRQEYIGRPQLNQLLNPQKMDQKLFDQNKSLLKKNIHHLNLNLTNPNEKTSQEEMEAMANRIVDQVNLIGTTIDAFTILELRNAILDKYSDPDLDSRLKKPVVSQSEYQGILPFDDSYNLKAIENLDQSKQAILGYIDTINRFFELGCPIKYRSGFIRSVIELANYPEDNIIDNYKSIISNNDYFKTICKVLINEPFFQNQENFRIACAKLNSQLVVTKPRLVELHPQPMTSFPQAKGINQSQTPLIVPTGNPNKSQPWPQTATPNQPPAVVQSPKTAATPQTQQQVNTAAKPPQSDTANQGTTGNSSGSGKGFFGAIWSGLTSIPLIGRLFSWIGSLFS